MPLLAPGMNEVMDTTALTLFLTISGGVLEEVLVHSTAFLVPDVPLSSHRLQDGTQLLAGMMVLLQHFFLESVMSIEQAQIAKHTYRYSIMYCYPSCRELSL